MPFFLGACVSSQEVHSLNLETSAMWLCAKLLYISTHRYCHWILQIIYLKLHVVMFILPPSCTSFDSKWSSFWKLGVSFLNSFFPILDQFPDQKHMGKHPDWRHHSVVSSFTWFFLNFGWLVNYGGLLGDKKVESPPHPPNIWVGPPSLKFFAIDTKMVGLGKCISAFKYGCFQK